MFFDLGSGVYADDEPVVEYSPYCAVYNIENNKYCYTKNADKKIAPAGTAKMITAMIALEHYSDKLDSVITIGDTWFEGEKSNYFKAGQEISVEKLVSVLIIHSPNDAAYVLANAISGSTEAFVKKMNSRASELGMTNTNYTNPAGVNAEGMYTTVEDVVKLSAHICSNVPKYIEFSALPSVVFSESGKRLYSRNFFVSIFYNNSFLDSSVYGLNFGWNGDAKGCLSVVGRNPDGNLNYIVVAMGSRDEDSGTGRDFDEVACHKDVKSMLNWAYRSFEYFTVCDTSTMICEVPVKLSSKVDHVMLLPKDKLVAFLPADTDIETAVEKSWELEENELSAPLSKGEKVGTLTVKVNGELLGTVDLVTNNNVDRSSWLLLWDNIVNIFTHPLFITAAVIVVIMIIVYIIMKAKRTDNKKQIVKYKSKK